MPTEQVLDEEPWSSPDADARGYIDDVIRACLRDTSLEADKDDLSTPEAVTPWEGIANYLAEDPEQLIKMGFITKQELEQSGYQVDKQRLDEIAFQLYEQAIDQDMKRSYNEYVESRFEDNTEFVEIDEWTAIVRELLSEAQAAVRSGDAESVVRALDTLFDQLDREPEDLEVIEHWADLLTSPTVSERRENAEQDRAARRAVLQAVQCLAIKLCEIIAGHGTEALRAVEWRHMEQVIATALGGIGFDVVLTPPSKDGGKDVIARCSLKGKRLTFYIEVSTSGYDQNVFTHLTELERANIRLGNDLKVVSLCQSFTRRGRGLWTPERQLPQILFENTLPMSPSLSVH